MFVRVMRGVAVWLAPALPLCPHPSVPDAPLQVHVCGGEPRLRRRTSARLSSYNIFCRGRFCPACDRRAGSPGAGESSGRQTRENQNLLGGKFI